MSKSREKQSLSSKTYSRRTATVHNKSPDKKCSEKISSRPLDSQNHITTRKVASLGYSGPSLEYDIRQFLKPICLPSLATQSQTESHSSSPSNPNINRKKRRLRFTNSGVAKSSTRLARTDNSASQLIQQTLVTSNREFFHCKHCGMIYAFWEEKRHNAYHQNLLSEFQPIIKYRKAIIHEQDFEGKKLLIHVQDRNTEKSLRSLGERALQFSSDNGLEMEPLESSILWGLIPNPNDPSDPNQVFHFKLYTMFHGLQLVALLLVERIGYSEQRYSQLPVQNQFSRLKITSMTLEKDQDDTTSGYYRKISICIERIWVHKNYQRKGLATRIIDIARANFFHPLIIPKCQVAISCPTYEGSRFFETYFRGIFGLPEDGSHLPYFVHLADTLAFESYKN